MRDTDTGRVAHPTAGRMPADGLPGIGAEFPYGRSIEWRSEEGTMNDPGPGRVWVRPRLGLVNGEPAAGLARVVLVADSSSGISSELDWSAWSFVNVDLDVHLARPVEGEWLLLDARTQLGGHGSALTRCTISDTTGELGSSLQSLVLAKQG